MRLKADQFLAALKFVFHAAARSDVRYYPNGVRFELWDNRLTLVATDGHRLAHCDVTPVEGQIDPVQFTLKHDCVEKVLKWKCHKTAVIEIQPDAFSLEGITLTTELAGDQYPDWHRVKSKDDTPYSKEDVGISVVYVADAMKACRLIANSKHHGAILKLCDTTNPMDYGIHITAPADSEKYSDIKNARVKIMGMRL